MPNSHKVINYVCECNRVFKKETLHPLVSLIDMSAPCAGRDIKTDCYAVVFKHFAHDEYKYGRRHYDFSDGTILFLTPNKKIELCTDNGQMLIFHPDLIKCTPLGMRLGSYSFFRYGQDEALHTSSCEGRVIKRCLDNVNDELCWGIDKYTKGIISNTIELLLNYCQRFYTRQFITRHNENVELTERIKNMTDEWFAQGKAAERGLITAADMSAELHLSVDYLEDMLRHETGSGVNDYVQLRRISLAKQWLLGSDKTVTDISALLGFSSACCFASVFKKITGCSPSEYRQC